MHPRRLPAKTGQKHEMEAFAEKYDTYADIFGDPIAVVFQVMADATDYDTKLTAANMLMSYRFPRVKAAEGNQNKAPTMNFNVVMAPPPNQELPALPVTRPPLTIVMPPHE